MRGKRTVGQPVLSYFIFLDEFFLKEVLGFLAHEGTTFMLNLSSQGTRDCMEILLPYGNIIFSILFCFVLCTKSSL